MNIFNDATIYRLVLSDAKEVIETCFTGESQKRLMNISDDELELYLKLNLDIPWVDYVEASLNILLDNLKKEHE